MNSSPTINILDIGSGKIQCLIAQPNSQEELEVIGYASQEIPTALLNQGHIINIDKTAKIIQDAVNSAEIMAGVEVNGFYINIPGILCHGLRSHGLIAITSKEGGEKKVTLSDLERVIDSAESVPIPREHIIIHSIPFEFKVDGLKVEEDPQGMIGMRLETDVYLLTCSKGVLDTLSKVVGKAGYELRDVISENMACAESVLSEEEKRAGSLVIDVGAQYTNVALYVNNSVNMTFSLPWGGDSLTRDLSIGISTGLVEAEGIKRNHGVLDYQMVDTEKVVTVKLIAYHKKTHVSQRAVFQIMEARMTEILNLVKKELHNQQAVLPVGCGVVITGGTANIPGIETIVRNTFNQSARVGYPLGVRGLDSQVVNPSFATSTGIAQMIYSKERVDKYAEDIPYSEGIFNKIGSSIKNFFT